jgi:hypothetical protein
MNIASPDLRIVYVAVTRARKALGIAVPAAALIKWRNFLLPTYGAENTAPECGATWQQKDH